MESCSVPRYPGSLPSQTEHESILRQTRVVLPAVKITGDRAIDFIDQRNVLPDALVPLPVHYQRLSRCIPHRHACPVQTHTAGLGCRPFELKESPPIRL